MGVVVEGEGIQVSIYLLSQLLARPHRAGGRFLGRDAKRLIQKKLFTERLGGAACQPQAFSPRNVVRTDF